MPRGEPIAEALVPRAERPGWVRLGCLASALVLLLASCEAHEPVLRDGPTGAAPPLLVIETSGLQAGPPSPEISVGNPYEGDAWARQDGERLYGWFNCAGCHGPAGGGGIGPPFADDDWVYGGGSLEVFQSIVQGRPQGMPSFRGRIPEADVWKIVLFVRALAGREGEPPQSGGMGGG